MPSYTKCEKCGQMWKDKKTGKCSSAVCLHLAANPSFPKNLSTAQAGPSTPAPAVKTGGFGSQTPSGRVNPVKRQVALDLNPEIAHLARERPPSTVITATTTTSAKDPKKKSEGSTGSGNISSSSGAASQRTQSTQSGGSKGDGKDKGKGKAPDKSHEKKDSSGSSGTSLVDPYYFGKK